MWIRIQDISVQQLDASHLKHPTTGDGPMVLNLFQREARTAFFVSRNKRTYSQYITHGKGSVVPRRKWTDEMKSFAHQELGKLPAQKGEFRVTIIGWLFLLLAFGVLGYITYDGLQAPARKKAFEERQVEMAAVNQGDIYFGNYRTYKEKGNVLGSEGGFGWFKITKIEGDKYHIAKSVEISRAHKPKEQMNSTDFEQQASIVKAKELEAYSKIFISEDGLQEFNFQDKKQ